MDRVTVSSFRRRDLYLINLLLKSITKHQTNKQKKNVLENKSKTVQ